jgi:S-formylglutathione hydrolase FrmB
MVGHVQVCDQDGAMSCVFSRAAVLIAYSDSPSLMQGWVPFSVEIVAAAALGYVLVWRRRRCGPVEVGVGLIVGLVAVLAARWALQDSGISGEVAPGPLWGWTFATGFAVTIAVLGWRRSTGWWRNGAALASSFCLLSTGLVINGWIGYLPTVAVAWDHLTGRPLPHQIDWSAAVAMRSRGDRPREGQLVAVDTGDHASHFSHRTEWVYLPPLWFRGTGAPLSAVMMIGGEFTTSVDWVRAGQAVVTADSYAQAHDGNVPVLVFVDANGAFTNDTECVNGIRGRAADHLTDDVVPDVIRRFGVGAGPQHWAVAGFSSGGTCAINLAAMHPELFGSFVDIAGDERPQAGTQAQTIQRLFGGDRQTWARFDPATVITRHGHYADTTGLFIVPESAHSDSDAARRLCAIGAAQGVRCSVAALPGRHTWPFAAAAFEMALPWLAAAHDAVTPPRDSSAS